MEKNCVRLTWLPGLATLSLSRGGITNLELRLSIPTRSRQGSLMIKLVQVIVNVVIGAIVLSGCDSLGSPAGRSESSSNEQSERSPAFLKGALSQDPSTAQRQLVGSLVEEIEPVVSSFQKPYQRAVIEYFIPEGEGSDKHGWRNIVVTLGWYYCSAQDVKHFQQALLWLGFKKEASPGYNLFAGSKDDIYAQFGPLKPSFNCSVSFTTPVIKRKLPGPTSRSVLDNYFGKYKDVHADPDYYADTHPPRPRSYYGKARG